MYLRVFVIPDARKERIAEKEDALIISVREPAAGNAANKRVRQLVADHVGLPLGSVRMIAGHRSRSKLFSIAS